MNWLYYLLESNLYLAVFYGFYRLFLHKETFYSINRYFLIIVTLVSFTLPLCKVSYINSLFAKPQTGALQITTVEFEQVNAHTSNIPALSTIISAIYLLVAIGFLLRMLISLAGIFNVYFKAKKQKINNVTFVELDSYQSAFSFFNILFINPNAKQKNTILKHEMIHITQNHSADILFFELIQIISWFSPIVYFIKKDIKLLHEYIADDLTTAADVQKHDYALFLIENSFGVVPKKLSNQIFNQSLIKRRIKMLNKEKSGGLTRFRLLLLAPVGLGLLAVSTMAFTKDYAIVDLLPQNTNSLQQDSLKLKFVKIEDVKITGKSFYPRFRINTAANTRKLDEKRLILINGKAIKDNSSFGIITNCDEIIELSAADAIKKYGDRGKFGAVELTGKKVVIVKELPPPPPPMEPSSSPTPPADPSKLAPPPPPVEPKGKNNDQLTLKDVKIRAIPAPASKEITELTIIPVNEPAKVKADDDKKTSSMVFEGRPQYRTWQTKSAVKETTASAKLKDIQLTDVVVAKEPAAPEKVKPAQLTGVVIMGQKTPAKN